MVERKRGQTLQPVPKLFATQQAHKCSKSTQIQDSRSEQSQNARRSPRMEEPLASRVPKSSETQKIAGEMRAKFTDRATDRVEQIKPNPTPRIRAAGSNHRPTPARTSIPLPLARPGVVPWSSPHTRTDSSSCEPGESELHLRGECVGRSEASQTTSRPPTAERRSSPSLSVSLSPLAFSFASALD